MPCLTHVQAVRALRGAARALDRTAAKLAKQADLICSRAGVQPEARPAIEVAAEGFAAMQAHMDFLGRLKQLHTAQLRTEVAGSELVNRAQPECKNGVFAGTLGQERRGILPSFRMSICSFAGQAQLQRVLLQAVHLLSDGQPIP